MKSLAKQPGGRFEWPKLRELLNSPLLRQYYVNYLSQAHNLENLHFLDDVQQFREKAISLEDHSSKICALALPIMDKYIVNDAPSQVGERKKSRNIVVVVFVAYEEKKKKKRSILSARFASKRFNSFSKRSLSTCLMTVRTVC